MKKALLITSGIVLLLLVIFYIVFNRQIHQYRDGLIDIHGNKTELGKTYENIEKSAQEYNKVQYDADKAMEKFNNMVKQNQ